MQHRQHMQRLARTAFLVLLVALLAGCGMARMAYNKGEGLSYFWLDRYVDFTDQQRPWVKAEIDEIFVWHRRTELPGYIELLQKAQQRVQAPVTEAEVKADAATVRKHVLLFVDRSIPGLADIALSMHPDQIAHLEKKFASNNDDYRKDNLRGDIAKRQRDRYKKALKQAEYFFGKFSAAQEQRLRELSDARPLNNELVLRERMRRQQAILDMLRRIQAEKPSREAAIQMVREYVKAATEHFGNADHKAYYQAYEAATIRQVTEIINGTTAEQKAHFTHTLQHWINDFQRLSER